MTTRAKPARAKPARAKPARPKTAAKATARARLQKTLVDMPARPKTATKATTRARLQKTLIDTPPRRTNQAKRDAVKPPSGPVFRGLRTVIYQVPDLERARAFYSAATGTRPYFDQPFYVGFNVEGAELGLDPDVSKRTPGPSGAVAYWRVDDIAASFAYVTTIGGTAIEAPHDVGGGIQTAIVADPFNNLVGLIEMP